MIKLTTIQKAKRRKELAEKYHVCEYCGRDLEFNIKKGEYYDKCFRCRQNTNKGVRNYQQFLMNMGLCIDCKGKLEPGRKRYCKGCLEKRRIYNSARLIRGRKTGDGCKVCRKRPKFQSEAGSFSVCEICLKRRIVKRIKAFMTGYIFGKKGRPVKLKKHNIIHYLDKDEKMYEPPVRQPYEKTHLDVRRSKGRPSADLIRKIKDLKIQFGNDAPFLQDEKAKKLIDDLRILVAQRRIHVK